MSQDQARGGNKAIYDLVLDPEEMSEQEKVLSKIRSLEEEFSQVLILKRLEESLVLMAGSLCWRLDQMSYVRLNSRREDFVTSLSPESRDILAGWLGAVRLLYDHFRSSRLSTARSGPGVGTTFFKTEISFTNPISAMNRKQLQLTPIGIN